MPKPRLQFHALDPSPEQRKSLNKAYRRTLKAAEGGSNDEELAALSNFVDELMNFAGIS